MSEMSARARRRAFACGSGRPKTGGLAGAADADPDHLAALKRLVDRFEPALVSEHLAWSRLDGRCFPDLLPVPRTRDALDVLCENVRIAQDALPVPLAVEYIAAQQDDNGDSTWDLLQNRTANAVNENAANGTAVGITASATDADATTNGVTYSLTDDAGDPRFRGNATHVDESAEVSFVGTVTRVDGERIRARTAYVSARGFVYDDLTAGLSAHCRESRRLQASEEVRVACLVPAGETGSFLAAVESWAGAQQGRRVTTTGPWPPFSFTEKETG